MKKMFKSTLSVLLVLLMAFSGAVVAFAEPETEASVQSSEYTLNSTGSIGNILVSAMEDAGIADDSKCHIIGLDIEGNTATVTAYCLQDATIVVGIYDEDTKELLASGTGSMAAGDEVATVELAGTLPKHFEAKAFMLGVENRPLCKVFCNEEHTKAFEEYYSKTVEDFEEELVVNLDEKDDMNFAVLTDGAKTFEADGKKNVLVTEDMNADSFVFDNVDATIKNLKVGDIFNYSDADNGVELVIKVKSIALSGTTATIQMDDTSLDEVFDYVKIEGEDGGEDTSVDMSVADEGVSYLGATEMVQAQGDINNSKSYTHSFPVEKEFKSEGGGAKLSVKGSLDLGVTAKVKIHYEKHIFKSDYFSINFSLKFSGTLKFTISGKLEKTIKLGQFDIYVCPGVYVGFTPSVVFRFSASFTLSGTLEKTLGFSFDTDNGWKDTSSDAKFKPEIKGEVSFYIGLSMKPHVGIVHEKIASASMTAEIGGEVTATLKKEQASTSVRHDCSKCIEGTIDLKWKLSAGVKFLNGWLGEPSKTFTDGYIHLWDFYYSIDHAEFGFKTCPHISYKVTFTVKDDATGDPIAGAKLTTGEATDSNGVLEKYMPNGKNTVSFSAKGYRSKTATFTIEKGAKNITVKMTVGASSPGSATDFTGDITQCAVGDIITFGAYPQSRVTDRATLLLLDAAGATKTWTAYPYYISGRQEEYMYYIDVQVGDGFYRGVRFNQYRPYYTDGSSNTDKSYQDNNGYRTGAEYWFKYDPIQWRVLNPYLGLVVSESILDSQDFNYATYSHANGKYANNWEEASIRKWLNETFMNTAFDSVEKDAILPTTQETPSHYSTSYNVGKTTDKVFLLSYYDVIKTAYGFSVDESVADTARRAQGSDYAKSQGLSVASGGSYDGNSPWWLRSAGGGSHFACCVGVVGIASYTDDTYYTRMGVRPALRLNLGSVISQSEKAGSVQAQAEMTAIRSVQKGQTYTAECGGAVPGREYLLLVRQAGTTGISSDNLWYIDQKTAESSTVTFSYVPSASGECTVEIIGQKVGEQEPTQPKLQSVSVNGGTVQYKSAMTLTPQVTADEGTKYTVTYSSSDPKVASVDKNGNITTHKKGTVTITCTVTNNDDSENVVETTCKVTVKYAWWQILIRVMLLGFLWY